MSDLLSLFNQLDAVSSKGRHNEYIRAGFSIHGGKSRSIDKILSYLPYRGGYCEPCAGAANILLSRHPSKFEVINDRHAGIAAFYRVVRDQIKLSAFVEKLQLAPHSREEFLICRDSWQQFEDDVERAFRWYYSFIFSFQSQGRHFGRSISGSNMLSRKLSENIPGFDHIHQRIKGSHVLIENLDLIDCLKEFDNDDMVFYIDPPYELTTNDDIYGFKIDHDRLLDTVFACQGFVAISSYPNPKYDKRPWNQVETWKVLGTSAQQNNSIGANRTPITEALYIKEAA